MQLDFFAELNRARQPKPGLLMVGLRKVAVHFVRHLRARRYILRVARDGSARVTIPRGGSQAFALEFARRHSAWLEQQLARREAEAAQSRCWKDGTEILFHGQPVRLTVRTQGDIQVVEFADQAVPLALPAIDVRPSIEAHLWSLAEKELVPRTLQLAVQHQVTVRRLLVRNQRSRWGSCSARSTISLNWRLIQAPPFVRDYLIIHELMHLREMNHSPRFWRLVHGACCEWERAEAWLDEHAHLLR